MNYPVVCFGEILWDILPDGKVAGGAPMNVTYHLKKLGTETALITRVGLDDDGKKLIQLMEKNKISTEFFQIDYELPTGRVLATPGRSGDVSYEFLKPVAWDDIHWDDSFESLLPNSNYFIFGSLATREQTSRDTLYRLREMAPYKILDLNLRTPHFTRRIVEELLTGIDFLKLNLDELELITGWFSGYQNEAERIQALQDKFRIPMIVTTKGAEGAIFNADGKIIRHGGFKVQVRDTIGSGDAFLAGLISKLSVQEKPSDALEFASAMGALVASYQGPCPDYQVDEIEQLITA